MKKVLVLSDSHGYLDNARHVLTRLEGQVEAVAHLGDHDEDARRLAAEFPGLPFHVVKGNNDYGTDTPNSKRIFCDGRMLLLCHGHKQRVGRNLQTLAYWGEEQEADVVLFGHTHRAYHGQWGRQLLFNPGSISLPRDGITPTFGLLLFDKGRIEPVIMQYGRDGAFNRQESSFLGYL